MYTVYKITNKINGKYYIGVHKTDNPLDGYMGSGLAIKQSIIKWGKENFIKEVLLITQCKNEAYNYEHSLTENYMSNETYNMKRGGVGGFTRENALKGNSAALKKLTKEQLSAAGKKGYAAANLDFKSAGRKGGLGNKGKPKSETHKQAIRDSWLRKKLKVDE
jgi:hypothetical protein